MPCHCPLSWPHALHRRTSYSHMCHIAAPHPAIHTTLPPPLVAACTASPHLLQPHMPHRHPLSWLHTPCCRTSHSHTHHVTVPHPAACTTSPPLSWPMVCSSCRIVL